MGDQETSSLRARPVQARSMVTFEKILDAAVAVILDGGIAALNTNAIAKQAEVNVGTIYHYFPDKDAILDELFGRMMTRGQSILDEVGANFVTTDDVMTWTRAALNRYMEVRRVHPEVRLLRLAFRSIPKLVATEEDDTAVLVDKFARAVAARYPRMSADEVRATAHTVVEISLIWLDRAILQRPDVSADAFFDEGVLVVGGYLAAKDALYR